MTTKAVVFLLPYFVALIVKLWSLIVDPRLMLGALRELSSLPKPPDVQFRLDTRQQRVIVAYVTHVSIKSTTSVTFFISLIAAVAAAFNAPDILWSSVSVVAVIVLGFFLGLWVIPSSVSVLTSKGWLGIEKEAGLS